MIRITTARPEFNDLVARVQGFLEKDRLDVVIDAQPIRGWRTPDARSIWIRDVSDMLRGVKYFETDLKSAVDHFAATQAENGRVFDYFTTFPEKLPSERENWTKYVRVPVEGGRGVSLREGRVPGLAGHRRRRLDPAAPAPGWNER